MEQIQANYEEERRRDQLSLFTRSNSAADDRKLARILAQALSVKCAKDLDVDGGPLSDSEIVGKINAWVNESMLQSPTINLQNDVYVDGDSQTYPYALIFLLFVCGKHNIALRVAKSHGCSAFYNLYHDYIHKYSALGLPKQEIKSYYDSVMDSRQDGGERMGEIGSMGLSMHSKEGGHQHDQYRNLLVHIMIGSVYKDDPQFQSSILFGNQALQIWVYLKLASFQYVDEIAEDEQMDGAMISSQIIPTDQPLEYQKFTLQDFRAVVRTNLESYAQKKQQAGGDYGHLRPSELLREQLDLAQQLFFSGQFSTFSKFLMNTDERFFIDVCHICIPLQKLNLLKTKYLLTSLLYTPRCKEALQASYSEERLRAFFLGLKSNEDSCVDLGAIQGYFINQMRRIGDESQLDKRTIGQEACLNGLTDAACMAFVMEDEAVSEAFLAQYVLNNKDSAIATMLEFKGKEHIYFKDGAARRQAAAFSHGLSISATPAKNNADSMFVDEASNRQSLTSENASLANSAKKKKTLVFDTMKLTVRTFLGDPSYKRVVLKIVEFNDITIQQETNVVFSGVADARQVDNHETNLLLLDRVLEHKRVLELLNRIQIQNIVQGKPKDFLLPVLDKEALQLVIQKKLKEQGAKTIELVSS